MRKFIKTAFIILTLLTFLIEKADAAVLNSKFIIDKAQDSIVKQVSSMVKGKVVAKIEKIPYETLEIPDGKLNIDTYVNLQSFNSFTVAKIDILVDGKKFKTFGTPVKLYVYDEVWVANDLINRGKSLSRANLIIEKKELGLMAAIAVRKDFNLYNCLTKKTYKPGDIIDTRYIEKVPLIIKNSPVSVIFEGSNMSITMSAQALDDGKLGDYIRVRSKKYKKEYIGKVISNNTILVNI